MALVPLAASLTTAGLVALAIPAGAITNACGNAASDSCGGQKSAQTAPLELAVSGTIAGAAAGTRIVANTPGLNGHEDFLATPPASGGSGSGGPDKVFRFDPRGEVPSTNLAITETGGTQSQLRLERYTGARNQIWKPVTGTTGNVVWINQATGFAMRIIGDTSGSPVQARSAGAGTGANENFSPVGFGSNGP